MKISFSLKHYPLLRKNVVIYENKQTHSLLINPYRALAGKLSLLSKDELKILLCLDGKNRLDKIISRLPLTKQFIIRSLRKWAEREWGMVEFLVYKDKKSLRKKYYKEYLSRIFNQLQREDYSTRQVGADNREIKRYHREDISTAHKQFENIETTVSHIYKDPHPLLANRNYGGAFARRLIAKGLIKTGMRVLEVGPGTGILGSSFLDEIKKFSPRIYKNIKYTFFDLSGRLIAAQKKSAYRHNRLTRFIRADIENYDFKGEQFDLVISNEMIADLTVVKLKKADFDNSSFLNNEKKRAVFLIRKFKIDISDAREEFLFNLGPVEFLLSIESILKPAGMAYIIEYGSKYLYPRAVNLRGHSEYSIHFGHLNKIAEGLKMSPQIINLADFLPFNKKIEVVSEASFRCINDYLLPFLNQKRLAKKVYTRVDLKKKMNKIIDDLSFVGYTTLGEGEALLDPKGFFVLSLKK